MIDTLREQFEIPQSVSILTGRNGFPMVHLVHRSGASAKVYLHGAHITSWTSSDGEELFFLSEKSMFEAGKPIRGGIPVIFPQFGGGALQAHGFARNVEWELIGTTLRKSSEVEAKFRIRETPETLAMWPHRFEMELTAILGETSLAVELEITNTDDKPFEFQTVLHTYFQVGDISYTTVGGLKGIRFLDSLRDRVEEVEQREVIPFEQETDRIYLQVADEVRVEDAARDRTISIKSENMPDVVVWNPWIEKSKRMADYGDEEYPQMVCVETGVIQPPAGLQPGEKFAGKSLFWY